jgi:LmbE family N-acetylglucosaminyl deacetylase
MQSKTTQDPRAALVIEDDATNGELVRAALGADTFLTEPVRPSELVATVSPLLDRTHTQRAAPAVLAVGAHPDDIEIGCGGALLRHAAEGHQVWLHTLTQGERSGDRPARVLESHAAAAIINARLIMDDLPDTSVPEAGATIEAISAVVARIAPTYVYTHSWNDNHQDHRAVHRATLVAARGVPEVACYQAPSTNIGFSPSRFVDVTSVIERKLDVLRAYHSQWSTRGYLNEETIRSTAHYWSRFGGGRYVEALEIVRAGGPVPEFSTALAA